MNDPNKKQEELWAFEGDEYFSDSPDAAARDYVEYWGDTGDGWDFELTCRRYVRKPFPALPNALEELIRELDEDYELGNPEECTKITPKLRKAWEDFYKVLSQEYTVYACDRTEEGVAVNLKEYGEEE